MNDVILTERAYALLQDTLTRNTDETCAVLLGTETRQHNDNNRILVTDIEYPDDTDYSRRGMYEAELSPNYVARITKHARQHHKTIIFAHSHPGASPPAFSLVDDAGEQHLSRFLALRHPNHNHVALVLSHGGIVGRVLGTDTDVRIITLGTQRTILSEPSPTASTISESADRQIRVLGVAGQQLLQGLRIAVVGLGGTGSLITEFLGHLGVRDFILVDPDHVATTNLNRLANATPTDVGRPKVDVAERFLRSLGRDPSIKAHVSDVTIASTARELLTADLMFGCTDSHGSRAVLQQIAYQYMIPLIDMGVTIAVAHGQIAHITGRVQLLSPGLACFTCSALLDPNQVRQDMMTPLERQADPYILGDHEPAPAVMSLNATVASLAVTMMLGVMVHLPTAGRYLIYNARSATLRTVRATQVPHCYTCSPSGALGRGDTWPLFTRQN